MPRRNIVIIELVGWDPAQAQELKIEIAMHLQNKGFDDVVKIKIDNNGVEDLLEKPYSFVRLWCNALLIEPMAEVVDVLKNQIKWDSPFDIHVVNLTQFIRAEARLGPPK